MEHLTMSSKERVRLEALSRVKHRELSVVEAAELMAVSLRQARRLWKRFKARGDGGLVHLLRGRASNHRLPEELRDQIVRRHQERYRDFGPTLACEKLAEEGLVVSPDTLTGMLKERHLWKPMRRRSKHRKRRERRKNLGAMIQMDGSHHDWFEGRNKDGQWSVLMVLVDDATGQTYARFYPAETTEAAFEVFGRWVKAQGVPRSVYVDRHSIYRDEDHPEKPTQFGRAMQELEVELIQARSPQGKGRVERKHRVFQDRLVKELRLRGISEREQANALLEKRMLPELNRRFSVKAVGDADVHRQAPERLEEILCVQEERVVGQDWCVRWKNRWLQIEAQAGAVGLAGRKVTVKQLGDGTLRIERGGQQLGCRELAARPTPLAKANPSQAKPPLMQVNNRRYRPGPDHPYNREARAIQASRARAAAPPPHTAAALARVRSP
jgi:Helix-turn-helix domain